MPEPKHLPGDLYQVDGWFLRLRKGPGWAWEGSAGAGTLGVHELCLIVGSTDAPDEEGARWYLVLGHETCGWINEATLRNRGNVLKL